MSVSSTSTVRSGPPGEARHLGTLVCVVLKAKNLPNKRSIGKQDPYCVLQLGSEINKTKPDKRGGQHPTWDEQLHFEIHEDMEEQASRRDPVAGPSSLSKVGGVGSTSLGAASAAPAVAKRKTPKSRTLRVACYADDTKEPEFIGEGTVDLTDTLRSGEFDEWVTIKAKDRYAGEVYLELTFYSSAAPPRKKSPLKPQIPANTTYGGAGTFSGDVDSDFDPRPRPPTKQPIPSAFMRQGSLPSTPSSNRVGQPPLPPSVSHAANMSTSSSVSPYHTPDAIPPSLRPSSSLAQIGSYTPPYAASQVQRSRSPSVPPPPHDPADPRNVMTMPSHRYYQAPPSGAPPPAQRQPSYHEYGRSEVSSFPQPYGSTYSNITQSSSTSTIRPDQGRGDGGIDDLVGGMSSMTVRPGGAPEPHGAPSAYGVPRPASSLSQHHAQPPFTSSQSSHQVYQGESYSRPPPQSAGHPTGSYASQYRDQAGPPLPTPTPPPAPHSAPPMPPYQQPVNGASPHPGWSPAPLQHASSFQEPGTYANQPHGVPPPPHYQHERQGTQRATSPAPYPPPRAVSPAVGGQAPPPPPPRGHTPGAYYALPQPPGPPSASPAPSQYQQPPPPPPQQQQQYGAPPQGQNGYASPLPPSSTTFIQSPYARTTSPAPPPPPPQGYPGAPQYGGASYTQQSQALYASRPSDAYAGAPSSPLPPSHSSYVEEARYKPGPPSATPSSAQSAYPYPQQPQQPSSQYAAHPASYQQQGQPPPPQQQQHPSYYSQRESQQRPHSPLPQSQSQYYNAQAPPPPPPAPYGASPGYPSRDAHAASPQPYAHGQHAQQGSVHSHYQSPYYQPPA